MIVVGRPAHHENYRMRDCVHAALFDTGSPVLVVPAGFEGPLGHVVAIAWKNDERAVKAVRASIPILSKARSIHVLCAGSIRTCRLSYRNMISRPSCTSCPEVKVLPESGFLRTAHQVGADLLVMGDFAHGEWREFIFGGVTRYMLAAADLPLLMRHWL